MKKIPTGIELFCGCGGLSTGFLDAGLRVVAGFDIDRRAVEAYNYNHDYRRSSGIVADLARMSGADLLKAAKIRKIDFLIGGPPCQPFSIVGKRRGAEDERAEMVFHFVRLTSELQPKVVLFENVPNLAKIDSGRPYEYVISRLRAGGYTTTGKVISAADFGLPQLRKRLLIVGTKGALKFEFPDETHGPGKKPYTSASQALGDLPPAGDFGEYGVYNHEPTEHSPEMLDRLAKLEPGRREASSFHDRLHPDRPSFTLRAGTGNFSPLRPIHYFFDRVITVRESARLQGFGDDFIWPDWIPRLQQYRQVGNAVPPPLAKMIAIALAKRFGWKRDAAALRGKTDKRPEAITMTDEQRQRLRRSRIRGASLGGRRARA
jgi:DNA (cytosine-5)-methyltransferase 1